jgi:hypothetical protein
MFPELTNSYKVVLVMQMLACYILVVVVWYNFGLMWGAVAFALDTLKDCFVVTALIGVSRANAISEETQRKLLEQRSKFNVVEGRLLDRQEMERPAPTLEIPGPLDDNWNN